MIRSVIMLSLILMGCIRTFAQDTVRFRDDEVDKKAIYKAVSKEMDAGYIKGFNQLWVESAGIDTGAKATVKYTKANERKPLTSVAVAKQLNEQVFLIWKFFRRTSTNIEGIANAATAFAISEDGMMVTNYHVLEPFLRKKNEFREMDSALFLTDYYGHIFGIDTILSYNENADLAIFKLKNAHGVKLHPVALGNDAPVGTPVYALTQPYEFPYYFSAGVVARNVRYAQFGEYTERMDITADYAVGSSGGPIVNEYGSLVGVVSSTHAIYGRQHEELQMVIKQTVPVRSMYSVMKK